jgi:hypothetical protein
MQDSVLYIIGNGFDLHHGVNSSYSAFSQWLKQNNPELFVIYSAICNYDALWSDFETSMAYVDRHYFTDVAELFLPDYSKDPDDWQMADILLPGDVAREHAETLISDLKESFHQWVLRLKAPRDYEAHKLMIDYDARFFNFNYTDFLETKYGISREQIKYIHGHKLARKGKIIVGHSENDEALFDDWWKKQQYNKLHKNKKGKKYYKRDAAYKAYKSPLPEYEGIAEGAEEYYEASKKPVDKIICDNIVYFDDLYDISSIYVWGFSFNKIDMPYLKKIVEVNEDPGNIRWYVSYYSEKEIDAFSDALRSIGVDVEKCVEFKPLVAWQQH